MRSLLKFILKILSRAILAKYKPVVIGITGSAGKTSTKEAVFAVLKEKFSVAKNEANFNNEIGVPMAILRLRKPGRFIWLINIFKALKLLLSKDKNYPRFLVLEMAADRPGDIGYLTSIAKPFIGIVTAIGEIPVHIEYYTGPEDVAKEKAKLIKSLPSSGLAVLNHDDITVYSMKKHIKAASVTFGFDAHANIRASDADFSFVDDKVGISFKLNYGMGFAHRGCRGIHRPRRVRVTGQKGVDRLVFNLWNFRHGSSRATFVCSRRHRCRAGNPDSH